MRRILNLATLAAALLVPCRSGAQALRIGLMPAVDSVPLIVAEQLGYFRDEGVAVELVLFKSQLYRESALQTGAVDGSVSDLINALGARQRGFPLRVTSGTAGRFALLAAPGSPHRSLEQWRGPGRIRTGLLENSVVYYLSERMLQRAGADPSRIELVSSPDVPVRLEMLLAGRLEAACLPEPLTRLALDGGASLIVESSGAEETPGVLLFTEAAIRGKEGQIRAVYRAYDRAAALLSGSGLTPPLREAIVRRGEFPPAAAQTMQLPPYGPARLPSRALVADVHSWMLAKGLLTGQVAFEALTDPRFTE